VLQADRRASLSTAGGRVDPDLCRDRGAVQLQRPRAPLLPARPEPQMGDVADQPDPKGERDRSSHEIALDIRQRSPPFRLPEGTSPEGGRAAARPAGAGDAAGRNLRPDAETRRARPPRSRAAFAGALHRRHRHSFLRHARPRKRARHRPTISNSSRSRKRRLRHARHISTAADTVGYSHRGGGRQPIPSARAAKGEKRARTSASSTTPIPPTCCPATAAWSSSATCHASTTRRRRSRSSATTAAPPKWSPPNWPAAFEAPLYGMLAVSKALDAQDWTGLEKPDRLHGQPEDERKPALLWDGEWEVTWVTFRDMGAPSWWRCSASTFWSSPSSVVQAAAGDPDAGAADLHRHPRRPLAVRRALLGDLDDRLHRARRHHRAQLDPAGGLHPPHPDRRTGAIRCARCCWRPARSASSRSC
jgi:hypothetical protein